VDPLNRAAKEEFFAQLGLALRPRGRWALFSMREDYVGALDPYLRPIPTRLGNTYRLDLLGVEGALLAIQQPALAAGVPLTDEAARRLVDDLRSAQVQLPDGTVEQQLGQHLEPVQLQVVCRRMWDRLPEGTTAITAEQVGAGGDINSALAGYYADSVQRIAREAGISERTIRHWFEHGLITPQGIRGQVLQGAEESHGLDNRAVWLLVATHLVRAEKRLGANWFELAHDRLISPVRSDNAAWFEANLSVLQRQAAMWEEQRHPEGLLLRDSQLAEAERWAASHPGLTPAETEFLGACRKLRASLRRQRLNQRLIQVLAVAACIGMVVAGYFWFDARKLAHLTIAEVAASEAQRIKDEHFDLAILLNMAALDIAEKAMRGSGRNRAVKLAEESAANIRNDVRVLLRKDDLDTWWLHPAAFLWGHRQGVTALAYRPDGAVLASGSANGGVLFWDPAARKILCRMNQHLEGAVTALAFSEDGNSLAAASPDGSVLVMDVKGIGGGTCPQKSVALQPDKGVFRIEGLLFAGGDRIAAHGRREILVWKRDRPERPEARLPAPETGALQLAPDPDSDGILVYSGEGIFRYDPPSRGLVRISGLAWNEEPALIRAFTPAGEPVIAGTTQPSLLIPSRRPPVSCPMDWTGTVVVAPGGSRVAARTRDRQIAVCDLANCSNDSGLCPVRTFMGDHDSQVLAFHPKSVMMASGGSDGAVIVWNPERNSALMADVGEMSVLKRVVFLPNGRDLIRIGDNGELSLQFGFAATPFPVSHKATRFALAPDGAAVAFTEKTSPREPEIVRVWKIAGSSATDTGRTWKPDLPIQHLRAGPDSVVAVVAARAPHSGFATRIVSWNPSAPQAPPLVSNGPEIPNGATFQLSPHGGWLALSSGGVTLFDLRAGTSRKLNVSERVVSFAFGGERFLAVKTAAPAIELWDVSGKRLATREGEFTRMAVGPTGLLAAVSAQTYEISVWQTPETPASRPQLLKYHDMPVNHLILGEGPDSRFLLSSDSSWTALWDVHTGALQPLPIRIKEKSDPVLSPDGKYVAGEFRSETDGMVLIYETNDNEWKKNACQIAGRTFSRDEWNENFQGIAYDPGALPCPGMQPPPDIAALTKDWTDAHDKGKLLLGQADTGSRGAQNVRALMDAASAYEDAAQLRSAHSIPAAEWYRLCRAGTFLGESRTVLPDCDRAVDVAPANPQYLDTRGIARAAAGDLTGAAADFESAIRNRLDPALKPRRELWIEQLGRGQNPVTADDLSRLAPSK
jgi:WD40 repeat protein